MAGSGIEWIDSFFNTCVHLLMAMARFFEVTYEEINVYGVIFLATALPIMSLIILAQGWAIWRLRRKLHAAQAA